MSAACATCSACSVAITSAALTTQPVAPATQPTAKTIRAPQAPPPGVWLPDLAERIALCLPPNEVACTIRLLDRAAAGLFPSPHHTTVRLSEAVPPHAFRWRWGAPEAARGLTLAQRRRLLCLTASSGCVVNLEVAVAAAGCVPTCEVLQAAAAAGRIPVCSSLRQHHCPWGDSLAAAAQAGRLSTCDWLLANGCPWDEQAVYAAARGGHLHLAEWLLEQCGQRPLQEGQAPCLDGERLLAAAAEGCDLAALQRVHERYCPYGDVRVPPAPAPQHGPHPELPAAFPLLVERPQEHARGEVMAAAAASPTADWRAKLSWLEARHYPHNPRACHLAAGSRLPDSLDRLTWLRRRGFPLHMGVAEAAARAGDVPVLRFLLAEGTTVGYDAASEAAAGGHLAVLQLLCSRGCRVDPHQVLLRAARGGHLRVVSWAVEALGGPPARLVEGDYLMAAAAASGSVELLAWLRERGWALPPSAFVAAARAGSGAALEWLAAAGCPMPDHGDPYLEAALNGDLATLRCLHRLGCPWGPDAARVFARCITHGCPLAVLRCLLTEAGCRVDTGPAVQQVATAAAARRRRSDGGGEIAAWLSEHRWVHEQWSEEGRQPEPAG